MKQQATPAKASADSTPQSSGQDAGAAFGEAMSQGMAIELPFQQEMEGFFGMSFDDVEAIVDSGSLASMGAEAAADGETVVFSTPNPDKQTVVHELTHVVQTRGGGGKRSGAGASAMSEGSGAETEARSTEAAFQGGASTSGEIKADAGGGITRKGSTGTPLERIREVANGGYMSGPDIGKATRIINEMGAADKQALANDRATMEKLAKGCGSDTILSFMNAMGSALTLAWKSYWIVISGTAGAIGLGAWQTLWIAHDDAQQLATLNWSSFSMIQPHLGNPTVLFGAKRATAAWGGFLAGSATLIRWLAASLDAQGVLAEITSVQVADGDLAGIVSAMETAGVWATMTAGLPRGSGLNEASRTGLKRLAWNLGMPKAGDLFKIRFNVELNTDGSVASWSIDDLKVVWTQLETLPGQDVSENTVLTTFQAISGDAGFWSGGSTVQLGDGLRTSTFFQVGDARNGTMVNPDRLPHTVRHEVGHAVHDQLKSRVDSWLQSGVGFWYYSGDDSGVDSMITDLGGYPTKYKDLKDDEADFDEAAKSRMKAIILAHSGNATWNPSSTNLPVVGSVARSPTADPTTATQAQTDVMMWEAMDAKIHNLFTQSDDGQWFANYNSHSQGTKGRYFWNHWYAKPFYFSDTAKTAIDATGDNYTAMSEAEFFANCYAEYFHDPAGYNDPTLWGGSLDANVKEWMTRHILERQPYKPPTGGGAGANVDETGV